MEDFLESNFSEDSNGLDSIETEAALYSLVHHSEDTYGTDMFEYSESYVNQRSKANRWEMFNQIAGSVSPDNYILQSQEVSQVPIGNGIASCSRPMYGKQLNKRGQYFKYGWNNHGNEKLWNVQNRLENNYHRNRNLVPVYLERKQIGQHLIDAQEVLKVNNFSSFDSPRSNLHNAFLHSNESNKGIKTVMCNEGASEQKYLSNKQPTTSLNKTMTSNELNPNGLFTNLGDSFGASKEKNLSGNAVECSSEAVRKDSYEFLQQYPKMKLNISNVCAAQRNDTKIIDISSENTTDEVVIVSDNEVHDDSDHSIVEVSVPPKPAPPIIALDSSDETDSLIVSKATLVLNISGNSDKSAIKEPKSIQTTPVNSKKKKDPKAVLALSATSKKIKKKKNKHNWVKSVECKTWTTGMVQFYSRSWGGETYDHEKFQQEMTNNPSKWKILDADKYGPVRDNGPLARVRCANCHQFGHMAKKCPDPRKIICCAMCGERGHNENLCPNKLCLKCGKHAPLFNEGCPSCWNKDHPKKCATCGADDHFKWLCPDVWRKLHSVTTAEEFQTGVLQDTAYKSPTKLNCCFCAGKGHVATKCPFKSKQNTAQTHSTSVNIFSTMQVLNKKRKKKRSSYFQGNSNQHEFNRKRRKTN